MLHIEPEERNEGQGDMVSSFIEKQMEVTGVFKV